jgi:hypothetical protein
MAKEERVVTLKEAKEQVEIAMTRVALLHLGFSRTLVEELGEKKGKDLIIKSILEYGKLVGEGIRVGRADLPKYGVFENKEGKIYDCIMPKVFRQHKNEDLGRLYCYVDPAKKMAVNPTRKIIHTKFPLCGDEYCSSKEVPTTEKERKDFVEKNNDWKYVDPYLLEERK